MPAPYDYTVDTGNPVQGYTQGLQLGFGLQQMEQQRQAQQAAQAQQAQMNADLSAASQDISRIPALMVRYPQLAEKLKHANDAANAEQTRQSLDLGSQVLSALQIGRPDVAAQVLTDRATALRNSGDEKGAGLHEAMAQVAQQSPDMLKQATALRIAALPGGDKVIASITQLGAEQRAQDKAPAELKEANSKAESAAVAAKFAESNAVIDLQKKGWDIKKIQEDIDIAKQNTRIAAMNAQTSRANSETQRQELQLKIEDAKQKRDDLIREKVATAESGAASIDNMLNTVQRIKNNPALKDVLGSLEGSDFYPNTAAGMAQAANPFASSADQRNDAIQLIDTLKSQAFLAQIPNIKGMGALSNAEGEKLQSALTNLNRKQSEQQFGQNLDEAVRLLMKGRDNISKRTGVPLAAPDTPAAGPQPGEQTATNPQTGEKVVLRNGKWVPVK